MKKVIIIVSILLVAGLIGASFLIFGGRDDSQQNYKGDSSEVTLTEKDNWLTVDTIPKLEELVKKNKLEIELDSEYAYVPKLPFGDGDASYNYKYNSDGSIIELSIGHVLVDSTESNGSNIMENIDAQELLNRINVVKEWIREFLNVDIGNRFYIFSYDGSILSIDEMDSYQKILNGSAFMESRILATDNSVWVLNVEMINGPNIVSCTLNHYSADSEEAKIPCNLAIEP